jgi:hypothetical protein
MEEGQSPLLLSGVGREGLSHGRQREVAVAELAIESYCCMSPRAASDEEEPTAAFETVGGGGATSRYLW